MIWGSMLTILEITPSNIFQITRITWSIISSQRLSLKIVFPFLCRYRSNRSISSSILSVLALAGINHEKACLARWWHSWTMSLSWIQTPRSQASRYFRRIQFFLKEGATRTCQRNSLMKINSSQMKLAQKKGLKRQLISKSWWPHRCLDLRIPLCKKKKSK